MPDRPCANGVPVLRCQREPLVDRIVEELREVVATLQPLQLSLSPSRPTLCLKASRVVSTTSRRRHAADETRWSVKSWEQSVALVQTAGTGLDVPGAVSLGLT